MVEKQLDYLERDFARKINENLNEFWYQPSITFKSKLNKRNIL